MDQATARELPEEFLRSGGTSIDRALSLVARHWGSFPAGQQRQLAQALIALLEPLLHAPPLTVPEALREECARVVALWEDRWAGSVANLQILIKATAAATAVAPQPAAQPQRALKFVSVELAPLGPDRHQARVQLERTGGGFYQGRAEHADAVRCAAQATAVAVSQALAGTGWKVGIEQTSVADTFGKRTVFVQVTARVDGEHRQLFGFCLIDADPARAAVLAVLNATNRFLDFELARS